MKHRSMKLWLFSGVGRLGIGAAEIYRDWSEGIGNPG
jgi:hypothetical protein